MKLIDIDTGREYSLSALRSEWETFRNEDPENHFESFHVELFEILMATINGRNDLDIVGLTPSEVSRFVISLRHELERKCTL